MGEEDFAGIFILQLFQAATRAAVAQALPFGVGHFLQRLGFPEESLLARDSFGGCAHKLLISLGSRQFIALLGAKRAVVQAGLASCGTDNKHIRPIVENHCNTIGLWS